MSGKRKKNKAHADIVANPPTRPRSVGGASGVNEDLNSWLSEITIDTSPHGITYLADWNLKPVVGRPPLRTYISQLWGRRHFIWQNARARAFGKSKNMLLGHAWLILHPLLDIGIYGLMFGLLLKTSRGVPRFVGYLAIGVIFFAFFTSALNGGSNLIRGGRNLIRAFAFPRAALAFSLAVRNFVDSLPTIATLLICLAIGYGTAAVGPTWFFLIPLLALQQLFCTGLILIGGKLCHMVPDLGALINLLSRFWFYGSGIFFSVKRFEHIPIAVTLMEWNPAYQFLTAYRECLLYGRVPALSLFGTIAAWSIGVFVFGFVFFWQREVEYGRER